MRATTGGRSGPPTAYTGVTMNECTAWGVCTVARSREQSVAATASAIHRGAVQAVVGGEGIAGGIPSGFWRLLAVGCLLFLFFPLTEILHTAHLSVGLAVVLAGMALFVGIYLWLIWAPTSGITPLSGPEVRRYALLIIVIAAIVLCLTLGSSVNWLWFVLYANFMAGVKLPARVAAVMIPGLTLFTMGSTALVRGWDAVNAEIPTFIPVSVLMIVVAGMMTTIRDLHAARQEIARLAAAEAVVAERLRFARDLHDVLGHRLSTITLKNELARRVVVKDPERAARELDDAIATAREALREMRETVRGYRQRTLATELRAAAEILDAAGITYHIEETVGPLPPHAETALAWAVREGVTNVVRHSRAHMCTIRMACADDWASVDVTDDGAGEALCAPKVNGHGLHGLAERAAQLGGHVEAGPCVAGGFRLRIAVPFDGESSKSDISLKKQEIP